MEWLLNVDEINAAYGRFGHCNEMEKRRGVAEAQAKKLVEWLESEEDKAENVVQVRLLALPESDWQQLRKEVLDETKEDS